MLALSELTLRQNLLLLYVLIKFQLLIKSLDCCLQVLLIELIFVCCQIFLQRTELVLVKLLQLILLLDLVLLAALRPIIPVGFYRAKKVRNAEKIMCVENERGGDEKVSLLLADLMRVLPKGFLVWVLRCWGC